MVASDVKALVFDVFGTVVDWRTSVAKHAAAFGKAKWDHRRLGGLRRRVAGQVPALHG